MHLTTQSRILPGMLILAVTLGIGLTACSGGGARVQSQNVTTTTTMGQELMDLERSYKQGIISKSEYEKARKAILKRYAK